MHSHRNNIFYGGIKIKVKNMAPKITHLQRATDAPYGRTQNIDDSTFPTAETAVNVRVPEMSKQQNNSGNDSENRSYENLLQQCRPSLFY